MPAKCRTLIIVGPPLHKKISNCLTLTSRLRRIALEQAFQNTNQLMNYHNIIKITPGKRGGKPSVRDTRITVYDVLGWLASGMTKEEILRDYPELTTEDIQSRLRRDFNTPLTESTSLFIRLHETPVRSKPLLPPYRTGKRFVSRFKPCAITRSRSVSEYSISEDLLRGSITAGF